MIVIVIVIVIVNSNSDNEYKDEENVVVKQDTWGGAGERTTSCQEII